jgi:hypothetical protein
MSGRNQPRRKKPRWGVIAIFLGIALAAFLFGAYQMLRPSIMRTTHSDGIAAFDEWQFPFETTLNGEPQLTELDDGSVQLTGVYTSTGAIDPLTLEISCQTLDPPPTWNLVDCSILPDQPNAFRITIQR